jgi:catalase
LVGNGFEGARLIALREELVAGGASVKIIGSRLGEVKCSQGRALQIDKSLATVGSVMFDAVYIPGGHRSVEALCKDANAVLFVKEAYKHGKAIAASNEGGMLITRAARSSVMSDVFKGPGVITAGPNTPTDDFVRSFIDAVAAHRFSERPDMGAIVA